MFSAIGSTMQSVGAAWLMTDLTNSHRLIALVQASVTLPIMLFGVIAGAIADNFDRRRVMLASQVGMLLASALLSLLTYEQVIGPISLIMLTLTVGIGTALNSPAWQASVRAQVGREDLPQAIALNTIAFNMARSIGPALGGVLISLWNVGAAFALNTVSYIALIWVLLRWRPEAPPPVRQPMLPSIRDGLVFCFHSAPVRKVLMRGFSLGLGIAGYQALLPAVVHDQLHGGEFAYGVLLGAFGLGSIVAAMVVAPARRRWGTEAVVATSTLSYVVALLVLPLLGGVGPALPIAFIAGTGWASGLTTLNVAMQMRSPENILGRCLSIYSAMTFGGMAVGAWLWGSVADWWNLSFALHAAALWLMVSLVVLRVVAPMPKPTEGRVHH
jgi:MFS family permease